jgi:dienelactone hydrolase
VDPRRLGVIGLSYGGTMTSHLLVNDPRLRAGVVSGYVSTVRDDALSRVRAMNTCGAQHLPGLLRHGDLPEVLGLAAPKPMLCEMATHEDCFSFPDMRRAFARLGTIYRAAGAAGRLEADVFRGKHMWSGRKAWEFLARWL